MTPHHVDSKQHMLSPEDILMVSAHDSKKSAEKAYKKAGSPKDVSPERVLYTVLVKLNQQPNYIRVREGNSLFLLVPLEKASAFIIAFNADKLYNFKDNLYKLLMAAKKMGYKALYAELGSEEFGNDKIRQMVLDVAKEKKVKTHIENDNVAWELT